MNNDIFSNSIGLHRARKRINFASGDIFDTRLAIGDEIFDEAYYLKKYPVIKAAVDKGDFKNGLEHYNLYGKKQGRFPFDEGFDEQYYLKKYPEIQVSVNLKYYENASAHYNLIGRDKGYFPNAKAEYKAIAEKAVAEKAVADITNTDTTKSETQTTDIETEAKAIPDYVWYIGTGVILLIAIIVYGLKK